MIYILLLNQYQMYVNPAENSTFIDLLLKVPFMQHSVFIVKRTYHSHTISEDVIRS